MKKNEILKIILILKSSYLYAFKDMSEKEVESMVNLYQEMFKENTYQEVLTAIKNIINTSEYMPTIAAIKNKIYELNYPQEDNNMDLWDKLLSAIRNSSYHSEEEFEKLPPVVQEYVRSPHQLQEMAIMDSETIHSVVKGQFLKQIENIKLDFKNKKINGNDISNLLNRKKIVEIEEVID